MGISGPLEGGGPRLWIKRECLEKGKKKRKDIVWSSSVYGYADHLHLKIKLIAADEIKIIFLHLFTNLICWANYEMTLFEYEVKKPFSRQFKILPPPQKNLQVLILSELTPIIRA